MNGTNKAENRRSKRKSVARTKSSSSKGSNSKSIQEIIDDLLDGGNYDERPKHHSDPSYKLPDPEAMMERLNKEVRELKLEVKKDFLMMEERQKELEETMGKVEEIRRDAQLKLLKGKELAKVSHLIRVGFDEDIIKEYFMNENKKLEKEVKQKQKDVNNTEKNVEKMAAMNKESEKVCVKVAGAYNQHVVMQELLRHKLENAEVDLHAVESRVKLKANLKGVELTNKESYKKAIQGIVRVIKERSDDDDLTRKVLKVASKAMAADVELEDDLSSVDDDSSSASSFDAKVKVASDSSIDSSVGSVSISLSSSDGS